MSTISISSQFEQGDYAAVALQGAPDQWEYHAARGFLGGLKDAIAALNEFDDPRAAFYSAVISWMDGDEKTALRGLKKVIGFRNTDRQHAANLIKLIEKPRINVLSQLPWSKGGPNVLLEGAHLDKKFSVRNIGFGADDLPNRPYADIHAFYGPDAKPDFYICNMVEWHLIPPNIQELDCPLIGHTSDFDVHLQCIFPWFRLFDEIMVCDHEVEYGALKKIVDVPVSSFVKTFGHPFGAPKPKKRDRDFDVFVSGSLFSPYHPDKALQVMQLLRLPDLKLLMINGQVSGDDYLEFVSRSKVTPCYCRHWGGALTRAIESLSMGSVALVQEGSIHTVWTGEGEGLVLYPDGEGPQKAIEKVLRDYGTYEKMVSGNVDKMRAMFDPETVSSHYFRFCTFLAARPRKSRDMSASVDLVQKRAVIFRGWVPANGDLHVLSDFCKSNITQLRGIIERRSEARFLNDMARELTLLYCSRAVDPDNFNPDTSELTHSIELFYEGITHFPDNLVLQFNLLRVLLHFGSEDNVLAGVGMAKKILSRPAESWELSIHDDVMPYDFCSNFFNYRTYLDEIVESLVSGGDRTERLIELILASIHHYVGRHEEDLEHTARAVELDGEFPFYALTHASIILSQDKTENLEQATDLLLELAEGSMLAVQAYWLLRHVELRHGRRDERMVALDETISRGESNTFLTEAYYQRLYTPYHVAQSLTLANNSGYRVFKRLAPDPALEISVVMVDRGGAIATPYIDSLVHQTIERSRYEIIYVELYERLMPGVVDKVDKAFSCGQMDFLYHKNVGLNIGLYEARGKLVVFCEGAGAFDPDFIEKIQDAFTKVERRPKFLIDSVGIDDDGVLRPPWRSVSCWREDALAVGGFDVHEFFHGNHGGVEEFAWRLHCKKLKVERLQGAKGKKASLEFWGMHDAMNDVPEIAMAARHMWPRLFDRRRDAPLVPDIRLSRMGRIAHGRLNASYLAKAQRANKDSQLSYTAIVDEYASVAEGNGDGVEDKLLKAILKAPARVKVMRKFVRAAHLLTGAFLEEMDRRQRILPAVKHVLFLIGRALARKFLPTGLYRKMASQYNKRMRRGPLS